MPSPAIGVSANFVPDANLVEAAVYIVDEDTDSLIPQLLDGVATVELIYNGYLQSFAQLTKDHINDDGLLRVFFINPYHTTDMEVRVSATIRNHGFEQVTVGVLDEPEYATPLGQAVHPQTDPREPRTEFDSAQVFEQTLEPAATDDVILETRGQILLFRLTPTIEFDYLVTGSDIEYEGGGNRFLPGIEEYDLSLHEVDVFPGDVGLRTFIEPATTNLIPNPDFASTDANGVPTGTTVSTTADLDLRTAALTLNDSAKQLRIHATGRGGPYTGPATVTWSSDDTIAINPNDPVSFSVLTRSHIIRGNVDTLRLTISWRNGADAEIDTTSIAYDPADLAAAQVIQTDLIVPQGDIPAGTAGVRWAIEFESVDGADDVKMYFALPQIEQLPIATSRAVGSRLADTLQIEQGPHIDLDRGTIHAKFVPGYDTPPTSVTLFDTREAALDGFVARHRDDGFIEFAVYDGVGLETSVMTDTAVILVAGDAIKLSFSWDTALLRIYSNDSLLKESTSAYTTPTKHDLMSIMSSTAGDEHLYGELLDFEIRSDVK